MADKPSKARQLTAVGEGLAVGCLVLGRVDLSSAKTDVELSFRKAWRAWPYSENYPVVKVGPAVDDIYYQIMDRSAGRRGPRIAWWRMGRRLQPVLAEDADLGDARALIVDFHGLPVEAWVELARTFTDGLDGVAA